MSCSVQEGDSGTGKLVKPALAATRLHSVLRLHTHPLPPPSHRVLMRTEPETLRVVDESQVRRRLGELAQDVAEDNPVE